MEPLRFYVKGRTIGGNKHIYAPRTRFIPNSDLELFEIASRSCSATAADAYVSSIPSIDLNKAIRGMWNCP
jgi:DNA helicase II / ATP-dependent DNA helicase PcrA